MQPSNQRFEIFRSILERLPKGPLVDLGAGHCLFTQAAREMGFEATAVDARTERVPEGFTGFIHADVRGFDPSPYSIVCILGLFYHLTLEDQLSLLDRCRGKIVIVDTHTARSAELNRGGYWGRDWEEVESPRSSVGNRLSFWHTEASLRCAFEDNGFRAEKIEPEHAPGRAFWLLSRA